METVSQSAKEIDLLRSPSGQKWSRIGVHKRSGVVLPLFSVYSRESLGIGELADLRLALDWCRNTGNTILQLLPLNETGPLSCPYDAISSFALEPVHLALRGFACAGDSEVLGLADALRADFPCDSARVDYRLKEAKRRLFWKVFLKESVAGNLAGLEEFREENSYWVEDVALFKTIKSAHSGRAWYDWPAQYRDRDEAALGRFRQDNQQEILFEVWLQWQLFRQFRQVKEYAGSHGVLLKGDLPILVSRDSADVWAHPGFFKLEYAAGAPPDLYCAKGQRWGMPTYNWKAISADDFRYLKEKLRYAQNFYDILRIDHVVGLFRIWSIPYADPLENQGLNGVFDPKEESLWGEHGRSILRAFLENTTMLLCAEDLGTIPKVCTETLGACGIPGNDVQRWTKEWKIKHDFLPPRQWRRVSVAMLSTHDTTNWPAWWEHEAGTVDETLFIRKSSGRIDYASVKDRLFDPVRSRYGRLRWLEEVDSVERLVSILGKKKEELADFIELYENSYREKEKLWKALALKGRMRESADAEIIAAALKQSLDSSAIFCVNTIIDWLFLAGAFSGDPYQYRFNTPGTTSQENWSMRLPFSLEGLCSHKVCAQIKKMVSSSGRIP